MGQLREANEHLVVANLRSQTLAEKAERAYQHVDAILSSITDAFSSFDHEWRCTQINPQAQHLLVSLHKTVDDVVGKNVWDVFPDLAGSIVDKELHRAAREHVAVTFEVLHPPLQLWFEVNAYPSADGLSVFFRDVTERKQAEVERARLAAIVDFSDDAIISETPDGTIVSWNKGAERIYGYTASEIVGSPISILVPQERFDERVEIHDRVKAGQSVEHFETVRVRKDGARINAALTISPINDDSGRVVGASTIARDISDRKRTDEKARESTERFRFLAESMPQKIFTARPSGDVDYFNQQWSEFTGLSFDGIKERRWTKFVHPDDMEESVQCWQHSLQTGEPFQCQYRLRRADGVYRWHLSRAQAMRDAGGNIVMWVGSSTDIDEQKRTEENLSRLYKEAESLNSAKDEFLATVSHELRTPMTSILGWTALLVTGNLDETTRREGISTIHRSAKAQAQLIDDILDVSRMITGKLRLTIEPVDMESVLQGALTAIVPAAEAKGLQLRMDFQPGLLHLGGDPARLQQVFWNLLSNAVKFTPAGGRIDVRLFTRNSNVVVEVEDTGAGIRPEFLPYAFDRFAQQEGGTMRRHGGMGIGLSIVKQLVELHGGTVSVASEGEGRGSTFTVSIPVQATKPERRFPIDARRSLGETPSIAGLRVLIVDDEPDSRRTIAAILEQYGAIVTAASSAKEGREVWERESFDVLLCDLAMPEQDGYSLIRHIRSHADEKSRIPAAALTAYGRPSEREIALAEGFNEYMKKPVEPDELISLVASAARRKASV